MGRVIDFGIKDVNNMGAAMAPGGKGYVVAVFFGHGENARRFRFDTYGRFGQARQGYSYRPHGARGRRFDKKLRGLRERRLHYENKPHQAEAARLQRNRCKRNSAGQSEKRADEKRAAYRNGRSDEFLTAFQGERSRQSRTV